MMREPTSTSFNPARLTDQIEESLYAPAPGWGAGPELNRERKDLIDWLHKKYKGDAPSLALTDKLEGCKPNARCKSAACPECGNAARQLLTSTIKKYLEHQIEAGNEIACVSIVPADGITNPGQLSLAQHHRNIRRWKDALARAGVTWLPAPCGDEGGWQ
jgi:hypothetical protein